MYVTSLGADFHAVNWSYTFACSVSDSRVPDANNLHIRLSGQRSEHHSPHPKGNENAHESYTDGSGDRRFTRHARLRSLQLLFLHQAQEIHVRFGRFHSFSRQFQSSLSHDFDLADCDSRRLEKHRHSSSPDQQSLVHESKHHSSHRGHLRRLSPNLHSSLPDVHAEDFQL